MMVAINLLHDVERTIRAAIVHENNLVWCPNLPQDAANLIVEGFNGCRFVEDSGDDGNSRQFSHESNLTPWVLLNPLESITQNHQNVLA